MTGVAETHTSGLYDFKLAEADVDHEAFPID
jgi:hypothetical protein